MATEISSIGKQSLLTKLFENCTYSNSAHGLHLDGHYRAVHRLFLEKVDFDLTFNPLVHLGRKLALNLIGELYAQQCRPHAADVVVALSNRFSVEDVQDLWTGITTAAQDHGIEQLSLDLTPSATGLAISLTAWGAETLQPAADRKPRSMDLIALSGDLGAAFMGLHVLEREKAAFTSTPSGQTPKQPDLSDYKYIVGEYLAPRLDPQMLKRFEDAGIRPLAGYFVTRGLGETVKKIATDTSLGVKIYVEKIPIASKTLEMAKELDLDPITATINGGEDYRTVFLIPLEMHEKFRHDFQDWDIIGHLAQPEVAEVLVTPEGAEIPVRSQGYDK